MTPAERRRLRHIIDRFKDKRILVVGDLMLDQYIRGGVSRISPEAPVPVVTVSSESFVPGGAGNVARNLAALGAAVEILGVIGEDEAGARLRSDFAGTSVELENVVVDSTRVTSQKCRVVAERQQVVRYDRETSGPLTQASAEAVMERLPAALGKADAVVLSDYGKGVISPRLLKAAISQAKKQGIPIIVDPKVENFGLYKDVTCITPNTHEAWAGMRLAPKPGVAALADLGRTIMKSLRCRSLLITRGPDGMSLFSKNGEVSHIPTQAREVFDVTGAGDTVVSVLTLSLACAASVKQAALLSNYAAGIVVGKLGTAVTSAKELAGAVR